MIVIKTILFFFGLIFTIQFVCDFILRIIGQIKYHQTGDEWHNEFVQGYIQILAHAKRLPLMIITWTCFYLVHLL